MVNDLFRINSVGIATGNDTLNISYTKEEQVNKINDILQMDEKEWRIKYNRLSDAQSWKYAPAKSDAVTAKDGYRTITYRPFDTRYTLYTGHSGGLYARPLYKIMRHMLHENKSLIVGRQGQVVGGMMWNLIFCADTISDLNIYYRGGGTVFPLYLYPEEGSIETSRRPNLDEKIWTQINTSIGKEATPEDIFDYIYGVLHSPAYRAKYKEFLKVDFPRIPYPKNADEFEHFRSFGNQLRELHLMHNVPESSVTFPESGSMTVERVEWKDDERVYINATQYFANVTRKAWEFYIGGYQPAQKWLKDRKGRTLSFDDIEHYRKIIAVLSETERLMNTIDNI